MKAGQRHVLVTGGCGYIGSHVVVELLNVGDRVTIIDNLANSSVDTVSKVSEITGKPGMLSFTRLDMCDSAALDVLFESNAFSSVIHLAGVKSVGESVQDPVRYYDVNIRSTTNLLSAMAKSSCRSLVFSSSATVYRSSGARLVETDELGPTNPYGRTKMIIEHILRDLTLSRPGEWQITALRYFNPIGAHESGLIGENPLGTPNNLVPYIMRSGRAGVRVFGTDYETVDGSGVRDYVHVTDIAVGHIHALRNQQPTVSDFRVFNLGTGTGTSVLQMIKIAEGVLGFEIPTILAPRRSGDVATAVSNPALAMRSLNWAPRYTVHQAITHAWNHENNNL
jgi:UDP-glucose 4-epimerase